MKDALKRIVRQDGFRGLYKGLVPSLFGVSHGAIQFMCYEEMKKKWAASSKKDPSEHLVGF